ncbi:MAG: nickel pincer cofactor biosynthesis protein LarC [Leptolyngbyaceae bacterium]|nr:nickel pincer cofactor biosynthesis protein LarC [Leptolyngbyaceae bacterium]
MSKLAYLECPTGIAGDMCLGALVHAGVPLDYLVDQLHRLGISQEYQLRAELVHRNGQQATKVHVDLRSEMPVGKPDPASDESLHPVVISGHSHEHEEHHHHHHGHHHDHHDTHTHTDPVISPRLPAIPEKNLPERNLPEIERLILEAGLPPRATTWSLAVFRQLAIAEGAVHGIAPEQVHFHEVGATDAIVDIVGTCLGLDWLGIDQLYCSALPTGGGTVWAAHGRLPVPTPAVLKLWETRQVPIYHNGIERELVTPTGAAIAVTLATRFGAPPAMTLHRVGLGAGSQDLPLPNMIRLWIGEAQEGPPSSDRVIQNPPVDQSHLYGIQETVAVLETQIDDLNPQAIGYLFEVLFAVGALDVFTQPISMKKSRPGVLVSVICPPEKSLACETVLFRETSTLGVRHSLQQRSILHREIQTVQTEYGAVRVKVAWATSSEDGPIPHGHPTNVQPEYEDCAQIAQQKNLPWREVHRMVLESWYRQRGE